VKPTLTSEDPVGWYECELLGDDSVRACQWWDGKELLAFREKHGQRCVPLPLDVYTNFRRLIPAAPETVIGDGKTLITPGRWRIAMGSDNEHVITEPFISWKGWTYTFIGPVPEGG
jgi:hypothetical protein